MKTIKNLLTGILTMVIVMFATGSTSAQTATLKAKEKVQVSKLTKADSQRKAKTIVIEDEIHGITDRGIKEKGIKAVRYTPKDENIPQKKKWQREEKRQCKRGFQ